MNSPKKTDQTPKTAWVICPGKRPALAGLESQTPLILLPLLGKSIIVHLLEALALQRFTHIVLYVSDRSSKVYKEVGEGTPWGLHIKIVKTPSEAITDLPPTPQGVQLIKFEALPQFPEIPLWYKYSTFELALRRSFSTLTRKRIGMRETTPGVFISTSAFVSPKARLIAPCWIGDRAYVGEGTIIGPYAVVEKKSYIDINSRVARSIIGKNTYVGKNVDIRRSLAGKNQITSLENGEVVIIEDAHLLSTMRSQGFKFLDRLRNFFTAIF